MRTCIHREVFILSPPLGSLTKMHWFRASTLPSLGLSPALALVLCVSFLECTRASCYTGLYGKDDADRLAHGLMFDRALAMSNMLTAWRLAYRISTLDWRRGSTRSSSRWSAWACTTLPPTRARPLSRGRLRTETKSPHTHPETHTYFVGGSTFSRKSTVRTGFTQSFNLNQKQGTFVDCDSPCRRVTS